MDDAENKPKRKVTPDGGLATNYDEYMLAMKRVRQRHSLRDSLPAEMLTPRERRRNTVCQKEEMFISLKSNKTKTFVMSVSRLENNTIKKGTNSEAHRINVIASMVPDEIIYKHYDHSVRSYESALMFIDISGFTNLCEHYTKGRGGPSSLTQVLNSYIGAMVQEILTHNGDVLNFSGDAFLTMWKKTARLTMQDVVHTAIDCGLTIQKNYGSFITDVGVMLKVKIAISAGLSHFSIIGGEKSATYYVIVGQPVWDVKIAEYLSNAGDVITTPSAWIYVNEAEYCIAPYGDGRHTKVLGVGATWKRVEKIYSSVAFSKDHSSRLSSDSEPYRPSEAILAEISYREYSMRPAIVAAMRSTWWPNLRRFMLTPVLRAVDNDEPMDFLTEVRRVVVVFINIVTKSVTDAVLIAIVDTAYKFISSVSIKSGGLVNKVSLFDKDMMFLVLFGLRGLKHEDETRKALECAYQCKISLKDPDILGVSIGVTSGSTYCGVVGHALRREYTVIGPAVNKAARLMIAYPDKVTCDKETFLRSKLDQEHFKLQEVKTLKGIGKPGPIYEFNETGFPERITNWRHPILGRNEELRKYESVLQNAMNQYEQDFTRYRDHLFAVAILGPRQIGKSRLLEEYINITPAHIHVEKIVLTEDCKAPYELFRKIFYKTFRTKPRHAREACENIIRYSVDLMSATTIQIHAINTIFDCRFPLPERFRYTDDFLDDSTVREILHGICKKNFKRFTVIAIEEAQNADTESWRLLLLLLNWKLLFVIMTVTEADISSPTVHKCLANHMIVKIKLGGIERWYHAAIACQLLDVQAIPIDLEKVIESASGGKPGWIQNLLISLVQRGALSVVTVPKSEAVASGAIMPSAGLLQRAEKDVQIDDQIMLRDQLARYPSIYSLISTGAVSKTFSTLTVHGSDMVQMAVLADDFEFNDLTADMAMDAVAKLFAIRVLECEGGDFTRDTSIVLIHPAPAMYGAKPPYCACLGTRQPVNCRGLPMYAFCGYMKFRHSVFRNTTYELLTEAQKHEMHARALMFLERYTRRCVTCGGGCFTKLLGVKCNEGLVEESEELKRTRQQIFALSAETKVPGEVETFSPFYQDSLLECKVSRMEGPSSFELENEEFAIPDIKDRRKSIPDENVKHKRVRSFSSLELDNCECLSILLSVYCQIIDHCRGAGSAGHPNAHPMEVKTLFCFQIFNVPAEYRKLFEAYLEYADLSVLNLNIPQAIRLLFEVEKVLHTNKKSICTIPKKWMVDFQLARVYSLRGVCMLESGDVSEAKHQLLQAMHLYNDPFPTNKHMIRLYDFRATMRQMMALYVLPNWYVGTDKGLVAEYYENIAINLNRLYRLFTETKEVKSATLAAKISLAYALRSNANFRTICVSYGNMIDIYRHNQKYSMCSKLEKRALELCQRKLGNLDVTQIQAVCYLYTNIFQYYVENGKKIESLEFGLSVMHMMTNFIDLNTRQMLVIWMLKLLLSDLRILDMVAIMREFFYMTDYYDLSSETWYYYYAMVILMDTGYSVESYGTCERFYIKKGDAILRSKTPEAAYNFFVAMWLVTIRCGAWEKSLLWEDKILSISKMKFERHEFSVMVLVRLVEGLLITLVREVDNRNYKKIIIINKSVKELFVQLNKASDCVAPVYKPRYFILRAYDRYIKGKKLRAFWYLNKAQELAKSVGNATVIIWVDHIRYHWKGTLSPKYLDYWVNHTDIDQLLDYRDFDPEKSKIVPFTLPLPKESI